MNHKETTIVPFLTFPGTAIEAVEYYTSIFPNSRIIEITRIDNPEYGEVGKALNVTFELDGLKIFALDMKKEDVPEFNWSFTFYKECDTETLFHTLFNALSKNGNVLMGPEPLMDFKLVTWVTDQFGLTWQLVYL